MNNKPEVTFLDVPRKIPKKPRSVLSKRIARRGRRPDKAGDKFVVVEPPCRYAVHLTKDQEVRLRRCAKLLMEPGKGILAADDSIRQLDERLRAINIRPTFKARDLYHGVLLGACKRLVLYLSGILMKEESLTRGQNPGHKIQHVLRDVGIQLGIRADQGIVRLPGDQVEYASAGLNDLEIKLKRFKDMGATFTLWRCVYRVTEVTPTPVAVDINSKCMARFAASSQSAGLVPIVSPEIFCRSDQDAEEMQLVLRTILTALVKELLDFHVYPEAVLIRLNAAVPGPLYPGTYDLEEITSRTMQVINTSIPPAFGGVLLARSNSLVTSINIMNAMTRVHIRKAHPLSFCYSHVIQEGVAEIWDGCDSNLDRAWEELVKRAELCSLGSVGQYPDRNGSLFISNHTRY